jgi:hypothetical protein
MKNPAKKGQGLGDSKDFEKVLATALRKSLRFLNPKIAEPEAREGLKPFVQGIKPLLEDLYCKYKVPPIEIIMLSALSACAPVPREFPKEVRNRRQRERTANLLEKTASLIDTLESARIHGFSLFADPTVDITLLAAAARVRNMKSIPGRPQRLMMKHYATLLVGLFRHFAGSPLYSKIAILLKATFGKAWPPHGQNHDGEIDAVKKLIDVRILRKVFTETPDYLPERQARELARKYEKKFDSSPIKATVYENRLRALLKLVVGTRKKKKILRK